MVTDNPVPVPPFIGTRVERGIPLGEIARYLNETSLFRNQWGYRPLAGETDARVQDAGTSGTPRAAGSGPPGRRAAPGRRRTAISRRTPTATTSSSGPTKSARPKLTRFNFPRQDESPWLCISDFFRPVSSGELDYAAFHLVSMGEAASKETARLFKGDRYNDYLHLHGLSVEMAEALAEYWHWRIREEWGFASEDGPSLNGLFRQQYRGGRYSWGYPACPDLEDNARCAWLLGGGPDRRRMFGGNLLAVPPRADDGRHHLPPPPGEVLHNPPDGGERQPGVVSRAQRPAENRRPALRGPTAAVGADY